ncbi:hypothetical protein IP84_01610 [beta proteobacterium AAP99]|nr:hypothetical protein IP84_01610 [beta proteobacterium AAP99]
MLRRIFVAAGVLSAFGAHAAESCDKRLVLALGERDVVALSSLLGGGTAEGVTRMLSEAGSLTAITSVERPRFVKHVRLTIKRAAQADRYSYAPIWINALSKPLGPVQFHAEVIDANRCSLAALHLDQEAP